MSKINLHPPQTYSRLFRPWDTQRQAAASAPRMVKQEPETITIKTELPSTSFGHDCHRDFSSASSSSSSSSNSSKSCYEDGLNHSSYTRTSTPLLDAAPHPVNTGARYLKNLLGNSQAAASPSPSLRK